MKHPVLSTIFIVVTHLCFARTAPANLPGNTSGSDTSLAHIPPIGDLLSEIVDVIGLQTGFELKEADVLNIEASISNKKRYILYNPRFIDWINRVTRDKWATTALLAHEVGHHLNGHTLKKRGSNPTAELEADEFAGFVLYKLGSSLKQAEEVMIYISNEHGSATHPTRTLRIGAIDKGWTLAQQKADATYPAKSTR
jgi:hypothetical protein